MTQAGTVSVEDVIKAFGASDRFPEGSPQFEALAPFIGHLIEIVGEDHLADMVGLSNLCDVTSRYARWLAGNSDLMGKLDEFDASMVEMIFAGLAEQMAKNPQLLLKQAGVATEVEVLLMDGFGLNEAAKELVRRGELTFAKLLSTSPETFIPQS
ncbi:MAG TPA: hypothetical protein VFT59_00745 [Candidatus Saccharimonadales bacterium]|nr:hypothetical protein [Candidatus Saccharimonadales bacterium]